MNPELRWLSLLFFLLSTIASLPAQIGLSDDKLTVLAVLEPASAKPGDVVQLVLTATVEPGFHAYGTAEQTNIPVSLKHEKLQLGGLEPVGPALIPPGEPKTVFGVTTFPLPEVFTVRQTLRVPAGQAAGSLGIRGELDYQVCDEDLCLPPATAPFQVSLEVLQDQGPKLELGFGEKLAVAARFVPATARAGEPVKLVLDVLVDDRYHAYGTNEPTNIPVAVKPGKLELGGLQRHGDAVIPPGEKKQIFGVDSYPLPQQFQITQGIVVPDGTSPGTIQIKGVLDYQLCDENSCDMPDSAMFGATLTVEAGPARVAAPTLPTGGAQSPAGGLLAGSLLALLLACVGGGLFALVMPCTYPMIPITFSFFTKQADLRGGKVLTLALIYGAGIVGMFALIGALAGVLGNHIVPFAAHWLTNVIIGGFFVVFGLSLLGLFTLQPPAFLVQAAGRGGRLGGTVGVLLMGATLVITSFTCTAPIVALLLVPAVAAGDSLKPILGMAVFGLTMALPFVLLSLLPGRVKAMPRSGEWMNTLKITLGAVELAAALKFFSNAEYVVGLHILPREVFFGIWVAIFVALAIYLVGLIPRRSTGTGRKVGGLTSFAFAGYCLYGALGYPLDFVMTALAPAYGLQDVSKHELIVDDYEAAAALAKRQDKLVLVNLTGFACANCRMVEGGIFPADAIWPTLAEHFVEARLHMDSEDMIPPAKWTVHVQLRQDLVEGRITTPTYVSVDPKTGRKLVEHVLSGGPGAWENAFKDFLERSLVAAGRVAKGPR